MTTLTAFLIVLLQSNFFTFKEFTSLTTGGEKSVEILTDKGFFLINRSKGFTTSIVQFDHNDKIFPTIDLHFVDKEFKEIDYVETRLVSKDQSDYLRFENLIKKNCLKKETVYSEKFSNYLTKYINEVSKVVIYTYSFSNMDGNRVYVTLMTKSNHKIEL